MGIFGNMKDSKQSNTYVGPDEEVIHKIIEFISSINEKIELTGEQYCLS